MSISQDQKAVVMDKQGLEYICSCIKLLQSVPELLNDLTPSQKTVYSSYKVTELINALGENLQTYVNTSLGALNNLKKEIVQTVPSVDTAEENTIYLLKNDGDGGYSQYLLINGVVENLGSTTAINNVYTKTETDAKFALLSTLNDLIATVGGLNELKTNTKESIVKAINELNDRNYLEVLEITDKSVLDYAKTFDILTHTYFYANNCVDLPNNEHYGYCSVEVSQDPFYRDITFYSPTDGRIYVNTIGANAEGSDFGTWSGWHKHLTNNDIVDTINSSSTDNQIPSALAVKTELDKKVDKSSITSTIDDSSTDNQVPSAKSIYYNCIEGIEINQTTIDTYGTEILKYPLGIWRIKSNDIASKFTDLPDKVAGRIEITSVNPNTNISPWNTPYSYRVYNFEPYTGGNYIRKIETSGTVGVIKYDTGWQRLCTTSVADVGRTKIIFRDTTNYEAYNQDTNTYEVVNGICYLRADVKVKNKASTFNEVLNGLPMPKTLQHGMASPWSSENNNANLLFEIRNGSLLLAYGQPSQHHLINIAYPVAQS